VIGAAATQAGNTNTNASFGALKQIDAGLLNVGYAEAGPADGPVVILLHGWPYDIHAFIDVAPLRASAGYRVIVPYLRLRHDALSLRRNVPQRPARGACERHRRLDGCFENPASDDRRL
jgi:dienelactone hydrolase